MEKFWTYPTETELCGKRKARPVWKSPRGGRDQAVSWESRAGGVCFLDLHPNLRSLPRLAAVGLVIRVYYGPQLSLSRSKSLVPADR